VVLANTTNAAGDPARAAGILVQVAKHDNIPSHFLLGLNVMDMTLDDSRRELDEAWPGRTSAGAATSPSPTPPDSHLYESAPYIRGANPTDARSRQQRTLGLGCGRQTAVFRQR
jgi:hypothetical protein